MPKYFREVNKHFSGDKTLAAKYMGVARSLLGGLVEMSGDVFQNARKVILPDGTKITVSFSGSIASISINADSTHMDLVEYPCDMFKSGLLSVENVFTYLDKDSIEHTELQWLYQSEYQKTLYNSDEERISVEEFADVGLTNLGPPLNFPATYAKVYAAAYSGSMRQAIQILLGMGIDLVDSVFMGLPQYKYAFGFDGTCGLVKKYGYTEENPVFWLIRMPKLGSSYGILAMNYPVCTNVTEAQRKSGVHWVPARSLTNFPVGDDLDDAVKSGKVIELLTVSDMSTDGFQPLYPNCGWAFSMSGHQCKNVLTKTVMISEGSDYSVLTKIFTVDFSVKKGSITALKSESEDCIFYGPKEIVPRYPFESPLSISLYPYYDSYAAPHAYAGSVDCPVHVYFDGDTPQVFNFVYDRSKESSSWLDGNLFNTQPYRSVFTPCPGDYTSHEHSPGTSVMYYTMNGVAVHDYTYTGVSTKYHFDVVLSGYLGGYVAVSGSFSGGFGGGVVAHKNIGPVYIDNEYVVPGHNQTHYPLLVVPFYQREGVYILDASREAVPTHATYPRTFKAVATTGEMWRLQNYGSGGCAVDDFMVEVSYYEEGTQCRELAPYYPELPTANFYTYAYTGALQLNALTGCYSTIVGSHESYVYAAPVIVEQSTTTYTGKLRYYGSGVKAVIDLGSSTEEESVNTVKSKIIQITSTSYIEQGSSQYIFAHTDSIKKDKYIIYPMNTADGAEAVTNTAYPVSKLNDWVKSFIGIAN